MGTEAAKQRRRSTRILDRSAFGPVGGDKIGKEIGLGRVDKELRERGASPTENFAQQRQETEAAEKTKRSRIARQRQQEQLRLMETESEIGRRKLLRRTGGRQSLIASN